MRVRGLRRLVRVTLLVGLLVGMMPATAGADGHIDVVASWSEITEGIAVGADGTVYVSHSPAGELWALDGATPEVVGTVPGIDPAAGDLGLLGLAAGPSGTIYGAVQSANPAAVGVWKFDPATERMRRVPGTAAIAFPNSIAFDGRGTMYVTDTALGAVWRVPKGGSAEPWVVSDLLAGTGDLGFGPLGANGVGVHGRTVYVAVTEQASVVAVPILADGTAGAPAVHAQDDAIFTIDGIAVARNGDIYAAVVGQFAVARIGADGSVETIASAAAGDAGILDVSSVAFGTSGDSRRSLFAVNFGLFSQPDFGADPRPAVVEISVGVAGVPLP